MAARKEQRSAYDTLEGMFFHTFDDEGCVWRQGCILKVHPQGDLTVEYFDWLIGAPSNDSLIPRSDLYGAHLYVSAKDWREAGRLLSRRDD